MPNNFFLISCSAEAGFPPIGTVHAGSPNKSLPGELSEARPVKTSEWKSRSSAQQSKQEKEGTSTSAANQVTGTQK